MFLVGESTRLAIIKLEIQLKNFWEFLEQNMMENTPIIYLISKVFIICSVYLGLWIDWQWEQ